MTKIINNGIISIGNHNLNTITNETNYDNLLKELFVLEQHCTIDLSPLILACKEKNSSKLVKALKMLGKETLTLIKDLGLNLLTKFIENHL